MGDLHDEDGEGFHQHGNMPIDHSGLFDHQLFFNTFMDPQPALDVHLQYGPRVSNELVHDDRYFPRGFYGSGSNQFHDAMPASNNPRQALSELDYSVYPSVVEHPLQQFSSLQAPGVSSWLFNGQGTCQHKGTYAFSSLPGHSHQNSHQFFDQTPAGTLAQDFDDNESVRTSSTDCDSSCDLDDACTGEECAVQDDACKDKECPGAVCTGEDCPEEMAPEVVDAAATLARFHDETAQQQHPHISQQGTGARDLSSSYNAFYGGGLSMATLNPMDIVKHIGMAHNDPASSNCMGPCVLNNPDIFQQFQHCPLPNAFSFGVDSQFDFDDSFSMNNFSNDGHGHVHFPSHGGVVFEECGARIPDSAALVEHFNTQHRHLFQNVLAQGNGYGSPVLPVLSTPTSSSSPSNPLQQSFPSTKQSPARGTYPPTPLSLCQDSSNQTTASAHHSRSSTVSQTGTGNEWDLQCLWCAKGTGEACGQIFANSEALFAHVNAEHIQKLEKGPHGFMCSWENCRRRCDGKEGFPQRSKIERHMHTHIGRKPFECKTCGQRFSAQQALTQHLLIHSDEKPLKCDWDGCGKTFRQQSALTMHRRIHTGVKPLKCPVCGKAFSESSNLSKHKRIHEKKGRFSCSEAGCNRSFHRLDQLRRHMKLHPGGDKKLKDEMIPGMEELMGILPTVDVGDEEGDQPQKKRR